MADIIANRVFYVHDSEEEVAADMFRFTVSDGTHNVRVIYIQLWWLSVSIYD